MKITGDRGSMLIDFLGYGLLLQIPVLLLATQFATMQSAQLAVDSIARHSLRSYVLQGIPIDVSAKEIAKDFNLKSLPSVYLICSPNCTNTNSILRLTAELGTMNSTSVMIR